MSQGTSAFSRIFVLSWVLLSLLAGAWAVATPIGGSPDEPAHLIKAASVVRGQFIGQHGTRGEIVQVPQYIAYTGAQTCYAFNGNVTANCAPESRGDPAELVEASTTAGLYNPAYYLITGWPSLIAQDSSGVYWMRIVSGVVVSLLLAISVALIAGWRRPTLPLLGMAIALPPMFLFLNGTLNPNSLESAATLATFVGILTVIKERNTGRIAERSAIVFAAAAIAANMRGLSLLWLAIAVLSPFLLAGKPRMLELAKSRPVQLAFSGTVIAVIAAAVWLLRTNSLGAAIDGTTPVNDVPGVGASAWSGFSSTLSATFGYAQGMVGNFGWLDTPAPLSVYFSWSMLTGGLLLLCFIMLRGRPLLLVAVLVGAVVLLPAIMQALYINKGGIIWQGRYTLPIFACAVVAAASCLADRVHLKRDIRTRVLWVVLSVWAAAQFASFATALHRYAVGANSAWRGLLSPAWSPPGGVWLSLGAFAVFLAVTVIVVALHFSRRDDYSPTRPKETLSAA